MSKKTVLIVKTGTTEPSVVRAHGDYDDWFAPHLEAAGVHVNLVQAHQGEAMPTNGFDGIILTGSPLSVRDGAPWMARLGRWAVDMSTTHPCLAICFGHQVVGEALGASVSLNPAGGEFGTVPIRLSEAGLADPLFAGLPVEPTVQATHRDVLLGLPAGCTLLAGNPNTEIQAFGWGPRLRAVQFHPEIPTEALQQLISTRGLEDDPGASPVRPSPTGTRLLQNWVQTWVLGGQPG
jgi:GMP synthase (glutamine-hydrolysing)